MATNKYKLGYRRGYRFTETSRIAFIETVAKICFSESQQSVTDTEMPIHNKSPLLNDYENFNFQSLLSYFHKNSPLIYYMLVNLVSKKFIPYQDQPAQLSVIEENSIGAILNQSLHVKSPRRCRIFQELVSLELYRSGAKRKVKIDSFSRYLKNKFMVFQVSRFNISYFHSIKVLTSMNHIGLAFSQDSTRDILDRVQKTYNEDVMIAKTHVEVRYYFLYNHFSIIAHH